MTTAVLFKPLALRLFGARYFHEIVLFGLVLLMAAIAFWGQLGLTYFDRKFLVIGLVIVMALSLLAHLRYALMFLVILLTVGANAPTDIITELGINNLVLTITLVSVVAVGLLNRLMFKLPTGLSESDLEQNLANHGATAMFKAVGNRNLFMVRTLLGLGIDPDIRARGGETPLIYAASRNYLEIVNALLEKGADVNARNNEGISSLAIAEFKGFHTIADILQQRGGF